MALGDILGRVGSILSANVNDLLDRAEDPIKMSAEFLRKANEELAEVRHEVAMVIASYEDTRRAHAENEQDILDWTSKAEMAIKANREDLARKALAEKQREEKENADLQAVLDERPSAWSWLTLSVEAYSCSTRYGYARCGTATDPDDCRHGLERRGAR